MSERTAITQVVQIGVESTPGTAVAADRLLPSVRLSAGVEASHTEVMPSGYKLPTSQVLGKEWTAADISAPSIGYDELPYLLLSLLSYAAPVQQSSTTAYKWTQALATAAEDTIKTLTVEQGSSVRAHKFAYGVVTDITLRGDRDKVELSGTMIGQRLSDGITLTSSPTVIAQVPILAKDVSIYADDTAAGLGGTKLTRVLSWELSLKNKFSPLWVVDAANTSWVAAVENAVQGDLKLKLEADSTGNAFIGTTMRGNATKFFRIQATSSTLAGTAIPYSLALDVAGQVKGPPGKFEDADGVYAYEPTFGVVHDPTWGKGVTCDTICKRSAL
jgi:hypothetical protein